MRLTANGRLVMPRPDWAQRAADDKAKDAWDLDTMGPGGSHTSQRDVDGVWWDIGETGARVVHSCLKAGACPKCDREIGSTLTCACGQLLEFVIYGPCIWFEDQSPEDD